MSSLRYALLGFLSLKPLSGYDLKRLFDDSVRHFWTADQAQIYRTLGQLADEGLVEVRVIEQEKRPDRKEHRITKAGVAELEDWLRSPVESVPVREPFLLRLFFAGRLPKDEVLPLLDERIREAEQFLWVLEQIVVEEANTALSRSKDLGYHLRLSTLDNGIRHVKTELDWLHELRKEIGTSTKQTKRN